MAVLALLLTPVTASTGGQIPHAHALIHLLIDGADGSFDHHRIGAERHDIADDASATTHDPIPAGDPLPDAARRPSRPADAPGSESAHADVAHGPSPDDLPVVSALSPFATVAATPIPDLLARMLAPAAWLVLHTWAAARELSGIAQRPVSPPPRRALAA